MVGRECCLLALSNVWLHLPLTSSQFHVSEYFCTSQSIQSLISGCKHPSWSHRSACHSQSKSVWYRLCSWSGQSLPSTCSCTISCWCISTRLGAFLIGGWSLVSKVCYTILARQRSAWLEEMISVNSSERSNCSATNGFISLCVLIARRPQLALNYLPAGWMYPWWCSDRGSLELVTDW